MIININVQKYAHVNYNIFSSNKSFELSPLKDGFNKKLKQKNLCWKSHWLHYKFEKHAFK